MTQLQRARTPTILIVDDEAPIREMLVALLEDAGFNVLSARDGATGLARAIEQLPDIVLTDFMMPEMNGHALCAHLDAETRTAHIPVVLMTATRRAEIGDGFADTILKPFSPETLLQMIDRHLPSPGAPLEP